MYVLGRHTNRHSSGFVHVVLLIALALSGCSKGESVGPVPGAEDITLITTAMQEANVLGESEQACDASAQVTWLGVTNYVVRYMYEGRVVSVFLDHQLNGHEYGAMLEALEIDKPDLVVIGHDHFDHTGECFSEGRWLCLGAKLTAGGPSSEWKSTPISAVPNGEEASMLLAPKSICGRSSPRPCMALGAEQGIRTYHLPKLGLRITAFPSAHSVVFGSRSEERELTGSMDAYSFLLEFPAQEPQCRPSMLWSNSLFQEAPFLAFNQSIQTSTGKVTLDYGSLLEEAVKSLGERRVGLWTAYAYDLPTPESLKPWMDVITPLSWTNHHHGVGSHAYFPELGTTFEGHPLGGPLDDPASPWIVEATPKGSQFLELPDYWHTFELSVDGARLDLGESKRLRGRFQKLYTTP